MDEQDAAAASTSSSSGSSSRILKFLTHKLRTHSLNEELHPDKADDDHDSGTESDDEFQNGGDVADELSTAMDSLEEGRAARDSAVPLDADLGASPPSTTATPFGFNSSSGCSSTETPPIEPAPSYDFLLRLEHSGDQHSSEEELEVINGPKDDEAVATVTPLPVRPSAVPEKRKWSEANSGSSSCTQVRQRDDDGEASGTTAYSAPASRTGREASGSSDEEIQGLCYSRSGSAISQPVQFRSSPPQDAYRPVRSLSPPPKLFHASAAFSSSPPCIVPSSSSASEHLHHLHRPAYHHRPRSRPRPHSHYEHSHHPHPHRAHIAQDLADVDVVSACSPRKRHRPPRPCLDFEKMQQLKTQAVTAWRHTSEHGNELSVFCW
ncbi:homeobox protein slou [Phymastichus coffea]|uniref:homeobox protein slou n=1 Tax=Phymastichus coffea TaxID=108790 RepID=UPI00273C15C0|nr:homeobox protein slou [Phymastichus coffea]XP_058801322.1 homeobox protein slou [Phymastichus coffea]XP_058801323.1 homeobox protein slou [Phymastichus coffea]